MSSFLPFRLLVLFAILSGAIASWAASSSSAAYSILHDGIDAGGRMAASVSYTLDGSLGGIGAISKVPAVGFTLGSGFGGALTLVGLINAAPLVDPFSDQAIEEGATLTFGTVATDPDGPWDTLTFSLAAGAPDGASVNPTTGRVSWATSESQGPGLFEIIVVAKDTGNPALTASRTANINVTELNSPPILPAISAQTVTEGHTLAIPIVAQDPDFPPNRLTYRLGADAPEGAIINPTTGLLSWTPTEAQGPGVNSITVTVSDNGTPNLSASRTLAVTVVEENSPPTIAAVGSQTVLEGHTLSFPVAAQDADIPSNAITYRLGTDAPPGITIDPVSGVFSWTPTEAQGPSANNVTVIVSDNGNPSLSVSQTLSITVTEENNPPVMNAIADQTVAEGSTLAIPVIAADGDLPPQSLAYHLTGNPPAGARIDPATGAFTWTPSEEQGPGTSVITVEVQDNGSPSLTAARSFRVTVLESNAPPVFEGLPDQVTIREGEPYALLLKGKDPDLPSNQFYFLLGPAAPAGMNLDVILGELSWTPTEAQGPSTNTITVVLLDDGNPPASTTNQFQLVVAEANSSPALPPISDQTIEAGQLLTVGTTATDPDLPANLLTFSLAPGAPAGAAIDRATGVFSWTPALAQGPSTNRIDVIVSDNSSPPLSANQTFTVVVSEPNKPPTLSSIADQTMGRGDTLRLTVTALDADSPANALRFSLEAGAPAGAVIDPVSGVFTWPSTVAQAGSTNLITVRVTDNGTPPLSDSKSFVVVVRVGTNLPPTLTQISNQTTEENTPTAAIAFAINDPDTPIENLIVSFNSSDLRLIPVENIDSTGSGSNRFVVITPATNQIGTATLTLTAQDNTGAKASVRFDVVVKGRPPTIVRPPQVQNALAGTSVTFDIDAAGTQPLLYQWRANGNAVAGATNAALVLTNVKPEDEGTYSVIVSNRVGVVTSAEARLTVSVPLTITRQPLSQTLIEGTNATVSVEATGTPLVRYRWLFNGIDLTGQTNATLRLTNVTVADVGEYWAVVSNPVGETNSTRAALGIIMRPGFTRQPQSQTVRSGEPATFSVTPNGSEPLQYQWRFRASGTEPTSPVAGTEIAGATASTLTINNAQTANEGEYFVVVSNSAGTTTSQAARLTVNVPLTITQHPQGLTVTVRTIAGFGVAVQGSGPLSYQWRFNGVDLPNATNSTLVLPKAQSSDAGNYQVLLKNAAGFVLSEPASLAVVLPVTILGQPQSQSVTNGASVLFAVSATGTGTLSYQWQFEGQNILGVTTPSFGIQNAQARNAGRYKVIVANATGPVASEEAVLTVITPPAIQVQPSNQNANLGASVTFAVGASGDAPLSYQWQKNGNNISGATNANYSISDVQAVDQGSYSVVIQNPGGALTSNPATLSVLLPPIASGKTPQDAPPPLVSSEGTFDGGSNETTAGQLARKSAPPREGEERWFSWQSSADGIATFNTSGSTFDTVMTIYTGPAANLKEIAHDDDGGGFLSSLVKFNAIQGTTYLISVKGFGGAAGRIVVGFKLQPGTQKLPEIILSPQGQIVPPGQPLALNVQALGTDLTYQWFGNGVAIPNATAASYTVASPSEMDALRYTVRVTGDSASASPIAVESSPASVEIGTAGSAAVDKFKSSTKPGGASQLQSLTGSPLNNSASVYGGYLVFTTFGATKEPGEPNHADEVGGASVWFLYQAPRDGILRVTTEGSALDTVLAIYAGPGTDFATLQLAARDNNSGADGKTSSTAWPVNRGTAYYVAVDGVKGATGTARLTYEFATGPEIATQPLSQAVTLSQPVALFVQLTNSLSGVTTNVTVTTYQWLKDGLPLAGQTNNSLQFVKAQQSDAGSYAVVVSNFAGTTTSALAQITVNVPLSITVPPLSQALKEGSTASFSVTVSGTPPLTYQWRLNGTDLPGATNATLSVSNVQAANTGSYTVLVQNPAGSVESAPAVLSLISAPRITTPPVDLVTTLNGSATFSVTAVGTPPLSYQWRHNGADIPGAQNAILVLNGVGAASVGDYTVVVSGGADSVVSPPAKLSLRIPLALLEQPPSQTISLGNSAQFNVRAAGPGPFQYQWKKNGVLIAGATGPVHTQPSVQTTDAGQYTVLVASGSDSIESAPATLTISAAPVITGQPSSQVAVIGTQTTLSVAATGTGPLRYQWFKGTTAVAGATNSTLILINVNPSDAGDYSVTVSNTEGSAVSTIASLTVQPLVSALRYDSTAGFQFRVTVPTGKRATVQVSADLVNWTNFTPDFITGVANVQDPQATSSGPRFFRVIVE